MRYMNIDYLLFFLLAFLSIITALLVITRKNPISSAMALVFNFFILAGIYLTLNAQFIAIIQILVYAGAIMVLFIFVIMLLNLENEEKLKDPLNIRKVFRILLAILLIVLLVYIFYNPNIIVMKSLINVNSVKIGTVEEIGSQLFTNYLLPFEVTSILILAAIIGSVVLAKKRFP